MITGFIFSEPFPKKITGFWLRISPNEFLSIIFAFTLSINDYLVTVFITGPQPLLPLVFWGMMHFGISPVINAISTIIFAISLAAALIGFYLMTRTGKKIAFF